MNAELAPTPEQKLTTVAKTEDLRRTELDQWIRTNLKYLNKIAYKQARSSLGEADRLKDAEDIFQEAMRKVWKYPNDESKCTLMNYARTQIQRAAAERYRRKEYKPGFEQIPASKHAEDYPSDKEPENRDEEVYSLQVKGGAKWIQQAPLHPDDALSKKELIELALANIPNLPAEERALVTYYFLQEMTFGQTAARIGRSDPKARKILVSALLHLQKLIEPKP